MGVLLALLSLPVAYWLVRRMESTPRGRLLALEGWDREAAMRRGAFSLALFWASFPGWVRVWLQPLPCTVDSAPAFKWGLAFAALVTAGRWVYANSDALPDAARALLFPQLCVGAFGALLFGILLARDINIELDASQGKLVRAQVVGVTHLRRRINHWLRLQDVSSHDAFSVTVGGSLLGQVEHGSHVEVRLHPGSLGARWVETVTPAN